MDSKNAHLYLPFVQALAEGKVVEFNAYGNVWEKSQDYTFSAAPENYRIAKPKTIVKSRRYIWTDHFLSAKPNVGICNSEYEYFAAQESRYFVKWIDPDWVLTEV